MNDAVWRRKIGIDDDSQGRSEMEGWLDCPANQCRFGVAKVIDHVSIEHVVRREKEEAFRFLRPSLPWRAGRATPRGCFAGSGPHPRQGPIFASGRRWRRRRACSAGRIPPGRRISPFLPGRSAGSRQRRGRSPRSARWPRRWIAGRGWPLAVGPSRPSVKRNHCRRHRGRGPASPVPCDPRDRAGLYARSPCSGNAIGSGSDS
jgi:hypothetical protein